MPMSVIVRLVESIFSTFPLALILSFLRLLRQFC